MRVTQSMISNNMTRNINSSYNKMNKLQETVNSQKQFSRPSDNPMAAVLSLNYNSSINQLEQYERNIGEVNNWLSTTETTINEGIDVLNRIRELTVEGANGTALGADREAIANEMSELKNHLKDLGNAQVNGKYIFNGSNTSVKPDGTFSEGSINIEIFQGTQVTVNTNGEELFGTILADDSSSVLTNLINDLNDPSKSEDDIGNYLDEIDGILEQFSKEQSKIGAKQLRVDLFENRLENHEVMATDLLSKNEDVDLEKVLIDLTTQQTVHQASLSVGAKLIQTTLMDFLK
ncbi:flagellar hook-associated protein FlgL [Caldibacillus lycopersici]|uniref:Flagellar hook-associated protein FlgL n=1 Tax=Perspicuibacillus lycopersici TaxID=1325689 RepID=A0AAE3LQ30_9BACI|nr:flagellar hook-associated protein FlgL [Perspicuibacillus lycopersici]MCU9612984.1 flagellar hook-associated protein FlgL [Perspicuibacillus lycopersici]